MRASDNIRVGLLVFLALSVSLPIAFVGLAKTLLFLASLYYLVEGSACRAPKREDQRNTATVWVILFCVAAWAVSLSFTDANQEQALIAFVKHGKLLTIPILIYLVRTRQEARWAVLALVWGQTFVLTSSWLMAMNVPLLWVDRSSGAGDVLKQFVPYADSYLDHSIMLATTAGILWHLSRAEGWYWARWAALAGLLNVLILMPGRTGYILAIAAVCLITVFEIPLKWRLLAGIFTPLVLVLSLFYSVPQFQQRVALAAQELSAYELTPDYGTSVGARLNMWKLSLKAIAQSPATGYGVGNWTAAIKHLQGPDANRMFGVGSGSNPHQELLLWTVELGVTGTIMFLALFATLIRDTQHFDQSQRRAALSVVVMLALTCLFNSPLYDDLIGDYFCVSIGLLMALGLRDNPRVGV